MGRDCRFTFHHLTTLVTGAWSVWALLGGIYFLAATPPDDDPSWRVLDHMFAGVHVAGLLLVVCGTLSLGATFLGNRVQRYAAVACAVWCAAAAVVLWCATPEVDQGDVESWLLLMMALTCFFRYLMLVMLNDE